MKKVQAEPTKDFFIYMLVRDIKLIPAIIDLVDNCVDGALRIRPSRNFRGLKVELEVNEKRFKIADNCGGIPVELARDYAFRFGRPPEARILSIPHSVGQFGVGMKRALFKMGKKFRIESTTRKSTFVLEVDVEKWQREVGEWIFRFETVDSKPHSESSLGTTITVDVLNDSVAKDFALENVQTELSNAIGEMHQQNIERGLTISLNGRQVKVTYAQLLASDHLKPGHRRERITLAKGARVQTEIWAGISQGVPRDGGWYVFCNGRMVLRADQSRTTGWNSILKADPGPPTWSEAGQTRIPKYHNQFDRFRGYVSFDSNDGAYLPWNTTKTGVDEESQVYRATKLRMLTLMRPVITFLNKLKEETEHDGGGPLNKEVEAARSYKLSEVPFSTTFVSPSIRTKKSVQLGKISYEKPVDEIERVKRQLKINERSNRRAGEKTFEYYFKNECSD